MIERAVTLEYPSMTSLSVAVNCQNSVKKIVPWNRKIANRIIPCVPKDKINRRIVWRPARISTVVHPVFIGATNISNKSWRPGYFCSDFYGFERKKGFFMLCDLITVELLNWFCSNFVLASLAHPAPLYVATSRARISYSKVKQENEGTRIMLGANFLIYLKGK
jgi:hypothetical protein